MDYSGISGTCSMGTLHSLDTELQNAMEIDRDIKDCIESATGDSRRVLIANLDEDQFGNRKLVSALRTNGFRQIGTYPGNSSSRVHVFMRGLTPVRARKTSKKAA